MSELRFLLDIRQGFLYPAINTKGDEEMSFLNKPGKYNWSATEGWSGIAPPKAGADDVNIKSADALRDLTDMSSTYGDAQPQ